LAPENPLGSYIKDGKFTYSSEHHGEKRQIIIEEHKLQKAGIDLDMKSPFLVIKGGYEIHDENWFSFTITFEKNIGDLMPFLYLRQRNLKDCWFGEKTLQIVSNFGPVRLGESNILVTFDFTGTVYVGGRFAVKRAVLYRDDAQ